MNLSFYKYQGTGNDFIMIDGRVNDFSGLTQLQIEQLCNRRFGIGADGFIILCHKQGFDFEMKYFNADGRESSMCGNGGRCTVQFAYDLGIISDRYYFLAPDGPHEAILSRQIVKLKMSDVDQIIDQSDSFELNTGSPHYVSFVSNVDGIDVFAEGRKIRNNDTYIEKGINVNFAQMLENGQLFVRTYERGVEDETFSCGTGVTAAAISSAGKNIGNFSVPILTKGGQLAVEFSKKQPDKAFDIWLSGPGAFVFKGEISI